MTPQHWSYFDVASGLFTGDTICTSSPPAQLPGRAPLAGRYDAFEKKVHLVTDDFGDQVPTIVDYQPPAPADDELRTWSWDVAAWRWVPAPTLLALQRSAGEPLLAALADWDAKAIRPVGEIVQASALGESPPPAAVDRLQEINAAKQQLRQQLAAIAASTTAAELASITAP
jgi:hypothetical protein